MINGYGMNGAFQLYAGLSSPRTAKDKARVQLEMCRTHRLNGRPFWARKSLLSAIGFTQRAYRQGKAQ